MPMNTPTTDARANDRADVRSGWPRTTSTTASTTTTIRIRYQTSGSAWIEIKWPRIAVKPHSTTVSWSNTCAAGRESSFCDKRPTLVRAGEREQAEREQCEHQPDREAARRCIPLRAQRQQPLDLVCASFGDVVIRLAARGRAIRTTVERDRDRSIGFGVRGAQPRRDLRDAFDERVGRIWLVDPAPRREAHERAVTGAMRGELDRVSCLEQQAPQRRIEELAQH